MLAGFVLKPGKLELALVLLAVCSIRFVELWFTIDCANPTEVSSRTKSNLFVIPTHLALSAASSLECHLIPLQNSFQRIRLTNSFLHAEASEPKCLVIISDACSRAL